MEQIKRVPLVHQVEEQIEKLILEEEFAPGKKLPTELELCQALGVSRGTIREAFRYLQAKGIVELRVGKGAFVAERKEPENPEAISWLVENEKDLHNVIEIRSVLEPLAARLAAERCTEEDIARLRDIHRQFIENADPGNCIKLAKLDGEFHFIIAKNCENALLSDILCRFEDGMLSFRENTFKVSQNIQDTIEPHGKILAAIAAKNPSRADREMRKHLDRVIGNLLLNISLSEK